MPVFDSIMKRSNSVSPSVSSTDALPENYSPDKNATQIFTVNDCEPDTVSDPGSDSKPTDASSEHGNHQTYYADELVPVPGLGNVILMLKKSSIKSL